MYKRYAGGAPFALFPLRSLFQRQNVHVSLCQVKILCSGQSGFMAKSAFTCTYSKKTVQSLVLPRVAGRRSDANKQQKIKYLT